MEIKVVGIDIGKTVFHLLTMDGLGKVVVKKRFSRSQLLAYTANLTTCRIGMEACCGAHYLERALASQGHQVRLIPAQFVKPFLKSNKNDFWMRKRSPKPYNGPGCALSRSRPKTNSIYRLCIA